jgi:hypothetical protein
MTTRTVFSPSHSALDTIFTADTTYIVPAYQRPYSWQAIGKGDKNNQVNQMWDDLWAFFEENPEDKEYFLGSMVIIERKLRFYEVVDGQQRLTTLSLLFAAMRCFLNSVTDADPETDEFRKQAVLRIEQLLYNRVGVGLVQKLKVKIERAAGYDFDAAMNAAIRCEPAATEPELKYREIAERYFKNRDYFHERLREHFLTDGRFTLANANQFDNFFKFLNARVSIVLIATADFETAYFIFETLNNRGLPLTGRDLLRNFLIKELSEAKHDDPAAVWVSLETDYALTEDFIGRWVESTKATQQRSSAFNDMVSIYNTTFRDTPGKTKAQAFCDTLREDLERYSLVVEAEERVTSLAVRNKIRSIQELGNERYSVNFLLALFRYYDYHGDDDENIVDFLSAYQRWMLHILLTPGVRFTNANVYAAIRALKDKNPTGAKEAIALTAEQQSRLIGLIRGDLFDNATAKLLVAVYVWHEEVAHEDVVTQRLDFNHSTLEHIIPQQPEKGTNWLQDFSKDFRSKYTYKLGNMTLLTLKMNSGARNYGFAKKKALYRKTLLPITRELSELDTLTPKYIEERHERLIAGILKELRL